MSVVAEVVVPECGTVEEQFEFIYRTYRRWVFVVVQRMVADFHLAEDLTAETFTQLWADMAAGRARPD